MQGKSETSAPASPRALLPRGASRRRSPWAVQGPARRPADFYHRLLGLGWWAFAGMAVLIYAGFNMAFTLFYLLTGGVANLHTFAEGFFFSLATMVTLNFGTMYPHTLLANVAVAGEALSGFLSFAVLSALVFTRLSKPTSRVLFAHNVVIARYCGVPTLMVRAANQRGNQIIQAEAMLALIRSEQSEEGIEMRRIHDLALLRNRHPVFALSWTLMHPIDECSPLYGVTPEALAASDDFLTVLLAGIDDTFNQTVHARALYRGADVLWHRRFVDILRPTAAGVVVDFDRFHDTLPLPAGDPQGEPAADASRDSPAAVG